MPSVTGQTIISNALTIIGVNSQGGTPSAGDSNDALSEFNSMWDGWGIDEGLINATTTVSQALASGTASYTVVASRIYKAVFVAGGNRNELRIVTTDEFLSHNDLSASARAPDECYINYSTAGAPLVFIWPIPNVAGTSLQLEASIPFAPWSLAGAQVIPPGYQDSIQYALAARLVARYGAAIAPETLQLVIAIGGKAEARIREENAKNRIIPPMQAGFPQSVINPEAQLAPPQAQK